MTRAVWFSLAAALAALALARPGEAASARLIAERGYETRLEGAAGDLRQALEEVSQLKSRQDAPPASIGGLRRRAEGDIARMQRVLQSRGYFEGTASYAIDPGNARLASADAETLAAGAQAAGSAGGPAQVVLRIDPGPQFTLAPTGVAYSDTDADVAALPRALPGDAMAPGQPALAAAILDAEKQLARSLRQQGFPHAEVAGRAALADVDTDTLSVTTRIRLGGKARFGALTVEGLETVERRFVERRVAWQEGETYDTALIRETRTALVRSGLFDAVRFAPADEIGPDGRLPVTLTVQERAHRTVGGGLHYSSTEGFGLRAYWENRNLLGNGQRLRLETGLSQIEQSALARYRVSGFRRADQVLELGAEAGREETDVYERIGGVASAAIERPLGGRWQGRAALFADIARLDEVGEAEELSTLAGLELRAVYDGADSALDPTRGVRLTLSATPHAGRHQDALAFLTGTAELRSYVPLAEKGRLVLANRLKLGSIAGARTGELPADKRFYAGGAGSIRGFEYQEVAPLGADGTAEGGRSLAEISTELRWRVTESFGVVPFADGGLVSDAPFPEFQQEMAWAAGLGFRYYTSFGPVGVDLAYPLSTPSDEEPSLKFYVTIGQAF